MARNTQHDLQPRTDHDGHSRRLAVLACKNAIRTTLQPTVKTAFDKKQDSDATKNHPSYRLWSLANRGSQNRMWSILAEQIDADYERIARVARSASSEGVASLQLSDALEVPDYQTKATIHGQPGGYTLNRDHADLAAGVLYEAGGNIYALGQGIGARDSKGERLIALIKERYPTFEPQRILEMGCSAGAQSTDYPNAFPGAKFHAIDLSSAMLRYAAARASLLDSAVRFHQQDAGNTQFPDQHFDLIVSHNLFHEVAGDYMPRIFDECFRLLRPGGLCIHQDVPIQTASLDPFTRFLSEWQTENNDEPFWLDFANADLPAMARSAGFDAEDVSDEYIHAMDGPIPWYVVTATR